MIDMYSHICPNKDKSNSWKSNPRNNKKTEIMNKKMNTIIVETLWRDFNQIPTWLSEQNQIKLKEEFKEIKK